MTTEGKPEKEEGRILIPDEEIPAEYRKMPPGWAYIKKAAGNTIFVDENNKKKVKFTINGNTKNVTAEFYDDQGKVNKRKYYKKEKIDEVAYYDEDEKVIKREDKDGNEIPLKKPRARKHETGDVPLFELSEEKRKREKGEKIKQLKARITDADQIIDESRAREQEKLIRLIDIKRKLAEIDGGIPSEKREELGEATTENLETEKHAPVPNLKSLKQQLWTMRGQKLLTPSFFGRYRARRVEIEAEIARLTNEIEKAKIEGKTRKKEKERPEVVKKEERSVSPSLAQIALEDELAEVEQGLAEDRALTANTIESRAQDKKELEKAEAKPSRLKEGALSVGAAGLFAFAGYKGGKAVMGTYQGPDSTIPIVRKVPAIKTTNEIHQVARAVNMTNLAQAVQSRTNAAPTITSTPETQSGAEPLLGTSDTLPPTPIATNETAPKVVTLSPAAEKARLLAEIRAKVAADYATKSAQMEAQNSALKAKIKAMEAAKAKADAIPNLEKMDDEAFYRYIKEHPKYAEEEMTGSEAMRWNNIIQRKHRSGATGGSIRFEN